MVTTRLQKDGQGHAQGDSCTADATALRNENDRLLEENECLIRQLRLIGSEFDEVSKRVKVLEKALAKKEKVKGKTNKRKSNSQSTQVDKDDYCTDNANLCTNAIIETLFDDECSFWFRSIVKSKTTEPCTGNKVNTSCSLKPPTRSKKPSNRRLAKEAGPRVVAIGTSLVKNLLLRSAGMDGITYCYPGQYVSYIRSRIPHILQDEKPDTIFLQCAGNDLERYPNQWVIHEYEKLINDILAISPHSTLILGAVPLRGRDINLHTKIRMFNTYLSNRGKRLDNVEYMYAAPSHIKHFKRDLVHFNEEGAQVFQNNIVNKIKHFNSFPRLSIIKLT